MTKDTKQFTVADVLVEYDRSRENSLTIAGHLMQAAARHEKLEQFEVECQTAEMSRKLHIQDKMLKAGNSPEEIKAASRLYTAYTQTKSDIRAMWKTGIHPSKFASYSALKKAKIEANAGAGKGKAKGADTAPDEANPAQALKAVVKGMTHAKRIELFINSLLALSDGDQAECLDDFEKILKDYEPENSDMSKPDAEKPESEVPVLEDGDFEGTDIEALEAAQHQVASHM